MSRELQEHEDINCHITKGTALSLVVALPVAFIMWHIGILGYKAVPIDSLTLMGFVYAIGSALCFISPIMTIFLVRSWLDN